MKLLLCIIISSTALIANAQITTTSIKDNTISEAPKAISQYDSIDNITRTNINSLVGQKLQIVPLIKNSYLPNTPTMYSAKPKKNVRYNNSIVVEPDKSSISFKSRIGVFNNQVFDIIGTDSITDDDSFMYRATHFYLIVKNDKYPNPCYLEVGTSNDQVKSGKIAKYDKLNVANDFIIIGYYEKLRKRLTGQKVVNLRQNNTNYGGDKIVYNLADGKPFTSIPENNIWTITDLSIIESSGISGLCYILTSEEIPQAFAEFKPSNFLDFETYEKENQQRREWGKSMIQKYGKVKGQLIIDGKVKIGFTREMCKEALGNPDTINKSSWAWGTSEQWIYGKKYFYFKNGVLSSIDQ